MSQIKKTLNPEDDYHILRVGDVEHKVYFNPDGTVKAIAPGGKEETFPSVLAMFASKKEFVETPKGKRCS